MVAKAGQHTTSMIVTVNGPIPAQEAGITDAHDHAWIAPVAGTEPGLPTLFEQPIITAELRDYQKAGGGTFVDCQPGGCGRDGRILSELSRDSGVHIVACTGCHLKKYYPLDYWLLQADSNDMITHFICEMNQGLEEIQDMVHPVRAGFIKIACNAELSPFSCKLIEAAAMTSNETGCAIQVHTEQGHAAEKIVSLFLRYGSNPERVVLCHMDKRPDILLHRELALLGILLEYDTFYRPKHQPDRNVWPLLERLVSEGLDTHIAIATDMADKVMWQRFGGTPGLIGLFVQIIPRLEAMEYSSSTIQRLVGQNIAYRLSRPVVFPDTPIA